MRCGRPATSRCSPISASDPLPTGATGLRLLSQLKASYPSSTLLERYDEVLDELDADPPAKVAAIPDGVIMSAELPAAKTPVAPKAASKAPSSSVSAPAAAKAASVEEPASKPASGSAGPTGETVAIKGITRTALPDGIRVSIEMNGEIAFHQERLDNPSRVFFDLKNARPVTPLLDATLKYPDELVEVIRLGRHPQNTTRVVMDMNGVDSYSVFTLYNPYRLVIDFHKTGAPAVLATAALSRLPVSTAVPAGPLKTTASLPDAKPAGGLVIPSPVGPQPTIEKLPASVPGRAAAAAADKVEKADRNDKLPLPSRPVVPPALAAPAVPSANSNGRFSIARQLGPRGLADRHRRRPRRARSGRARQRRSTSRNWCSTSRCACASCSTISRGWKW